MDVPSKINGMRVIRYGVLDWPDERAGDGARQEGCPIRSVRFVAIGRGSGPGSYCTFFCNAEWQVIESEFSETLSRAASVAESRCVENFQWCFWENRLVSMLEFAQKWIAYSVIAFVALPLVAFLMPLPEGLLLVGLFASAIAWAVAALAIWFVVARVAVASGGWVYGILHLLLTILFTPSLFGLFVFPALVLGDLYRWREWDETQPERQDLGRRPETNPDT